MGTKRQYRVTFDRDSKRRIDPFELAWLLSKNECDVVAKNERPMLFVRASAYDMLMLIADLRIAFGDVIEDVELPQREYGGFVSILHNTINQS